MASYTLTNTADEIDSSIQRVSSADTTPLTNSTQMVTSGGVKAYVDTAVDPLNTDVSELQTKVDTLIAVSISTAGLSGGTAIAFTTVTHRVGVNAASHQLVRQTTNVMRTPTSGVSLVSVNATVYDNDTSLDNNYLLRLNVNGVVVAQTMTANADDEVTYNQLCYSGFMPQNNTIALDVVRVSGASTGYSVTGDITCVNYQ